jgi:2-keto-4-pentenoate hydratase
VTPAAIAAIADRLMAAHDAATKLAPISASEPAFDVAAAYAVLDEIERRRCAQGWQPAGRKIGFTNRTIWARYGVYQPMWAHAWRHTVQYAPAGRATRSIDGLVQPRIEPEVVFRLRAPVPVTDDAEAILRCVEWIAAGFEIVQSHFPDWKFTAADCTAAFGLHGALVVGTPLAVTDLNRAAIAAALPAFALELRHGGTLVDTGVGANVLGSPALALAHLARVLATQPWAPPLAAGEVITTGTVTDAWPVAPGQTWTSDYGALGVAGLTLTLGSAA